MTVPFPCVCQLKRIYSLPLRYKQMFRITYAVSKEGLVLSIILYRNHTPCLHGLSPVRLVVSVQKILFWWSIPAWLSNACNTHQETIGVDVLPQWVPLPKGWQKEAVPSPSFSEGKEPLSYPSSGANNVFAVTTHRMDNWVYVSFGIRWLFAAHTPGVSWLWAASGLEALLPHEHVEQSQRINAPS